MNPIILRKRWWMPVPYGKADGITLYPFIIMRSGWSERLMRHELVHFQQVRGIGWWKFYFMYIFSKSFRRDMEKDAYILQNLPMFPLSLESLVHADDQQNPKAQDQTPGAGVSAREDEG